MSNFCYFCGCLLNSQNQHEEHIIQNGIGGILKPIDILCQTCGTVLNNEIDVSFVNIFSLFSARLKIRRNRNTNPRTYAGLQNGQKVNWTDFKVTPQKPYYRFDEKTGILEIFANEKVGNHYKNVAISKVGQNRISEVKIVDDISKNGPISFPFSFDNKVFKQGLAKIAVGFATHKGIPRNELNAVLNSKSNSFLHDILVLPYFPFNTLERFLEIDRIGLDSLYPSHFLILFTIPKMQGGMKTPKKLLLCYIELFSTFQQYVILNYDYGGADVYETFGQRLFQREDFEIDSNLDPKTISIHLSQFEICPAEIQNLGMNEIAHLISARSRQQKYIINAPQHFRDLIDSILFLSICQLCPEKSPSKKASKENLNAFNEYFYQNAQRLDFLRQNINLFYSTSNSGEEVFIPKVFRCYLVNEKGHKTNYYSEIVENIGDHDQFRRYSYLKFVTV